MTAPADAAARLAYLERRSAALEAECAALGDALDAAHRLLAERDAALLLLGLYLAQAQEDRDRYLGRLRDDLTGHGVWGQTQEGR